MLNLRALLVLGLLGSCFRSSAVFPVVAIASPSRAASVDGHSVQASAYQVDNGRVSLVLLDVDLPDDSGASTTGESAPEHRTLLVMFSPEQVHHSITPHASISSAPEQGFDGLEVRQGVIVDSSGVIGHMTVHPSSAIAPLDFEFRADLRSRGRGGSQGAQQAEEVSNPRLILGQQEKPSPNGGVFLCLLDFQGGPRAVLLPNSPKPVDIAADPDGYYQRLLRSEPVIAEVFSEKP